jgi:hypothetical protein
MTPRALAVLVLAVRASVCAAQGSEPRPRDAAEVVREGDVSQWLKYYQREREMQTPAPQPARSPEPAAQTNGKDAPSQR